MDKEIENLKGGDPMTLWGIADDLEQESPNCPSCIMMAAELKSIAECDDQVLHVENYEPLTASTPQPINKKNEPRTKNKIAISR